MFEEWAMTMKITECNDFNIVLSCAMMLLDYAAALREQDTVDMINEVVLPITKQVNSDLGRMEVMR